MTSANTVMLSVVIIIAIFIVSSIKRCRALSLPPGPATLPFLGNYLSLPKQRPWVAYANWAQAFRSDLITINVFGQPNIIINSMEAAKELLERRSAKYADRPASTMLEMMGWDFNIGFMHYSARWRSKRRLFHESLHSTAAVAYRPMQKIKVREMLPKLLDDVEHFEEHVHKMAGSVSIEMSYGHIDDEQLNKRILHAVQESMDMMGQATLPGAAAAVNMFPFLQYLPSGLPGMGFKPFAHQCKASVTYMRNTPWECVKQGMANSSAFPSMASKLLNQLQEKPPRSDGEEDAKDVCGATYAAGTDTTTTAVMTAILALLLHPEVQRRAQDEIDDVVGRDRLPTYEDRDSLPYVEAIYREVLRWNPVLPLGVSRAAYEDDIYKGHFIPKGSVVSWNTWAITHDPALYPEPDSFKPERFLTTDGTLNDDDMRVAFGFGRRICVGMHLADATVWLTIVSLLAAFRVVPAKDENGNNVIANVEYTDALVSHPLPFKCVFEPRNKEAELLIAQLRDPEAAEQL